MKFTDIQEFKAGDIIRYNPWSQRGPGRGIGLFNGTYRQEPGYLGSRPAQGAVVRPLTFTDGRWRLYDTSIEVPSRQVHSLLGRPTGSGPEAWCDDLTVLANAEDKAREAAREADRLAVRAKHQGWVDQARDLGLLVWYVGYEQVDHDGAENYTAKVDNRGGISLSYECLIELLDLAK